MKELEYINEMCPLFKNGVSKREIRHNFFEKIETELQAYLLGFIFADGCIWKDGLAFKIHINDIDIELFDYFKIISPDAKIRYLDGYESKALVRGRTVKNKSSIELNICSKQLVGDLIKHGAVERKTYEQLSIPEMPDDLIRHFIRGYFDGDGSFTWGATKPNSKNGQKNWSVRAHVMIDAKTNNLLLEFQKYMANSGIMMNFNYLKRDDMYRLCCSSKKAILQVFDFLYKDTHYYLSRKFNKYSHYVNTEVTQLIAEYRNA